MGLNRRRINAAMAAGALAIVLAGPWTAHAQSVLRLVPQADLKILDTVQTTNNITSNHGYMIYDTLFSLDSKLTPKPQMVESYTKSADGLTWTFKLRPGLKFHDGQAGDGKGRGGVDPALFQAHPGRRDDDAVREGDRGHRPRHLRDPPQQAVRVGAGDAGGPGKSAVHHARSRGASSIRTPR